MQTLHMLSRQLEFDTLSLHPHCFCASSVCPPVPAFVNSAAIDDGGVRRPPKRKRTNATDGTDTPARSGPRHGPKKKKANRACFHCQKAHFTCDDSRSCQRCTKRGIASSCTEGH
ncbi:hypothetical protein BDZ89DRAFT_376756 [Hymenopellis radicata]|nr:hypothetical protein BDZ89DRAFT_376756 [Hymenopellis radicata]